MENNKKRRFNRWTEFLLGLCIGLLLVTIIHLISSPNNNQSDKFCSSDRSHSPYLIQRDTIDGGFSRGWMPHFLPSEEYWVDMHTHLSGITGAGQLQQLIDDWFARLDAYRLGKVVAITEQDELFNLFGQMVANEPRFAWMYWPDIDQPSFSLVREAMNHGACALKIHNVKIIEGKTPRKIWESEAWQQIFAFAETNGVPILWHVTQRHGYSPYHGGGLNSYWKSGWALGVDFTNEDLLQDVLAYRIKKPPPE
jgi:hypothetical protein